MSTGDATPSCGHAQLPGLTECLCCRLNQIEDDAARYRWLARQARMRQDHWHQNIEQLIEVIFYAPPLVDNERPKFYMSLSDAIDAAIRAQLPINGGMHGR